MSSSTGDADEDEEDAQSIVTIACATQDYVEECEKDIKCQDEDELVLCAGKLACGAAIAATKLRTNQEQKIESVEDKESISEERQTNRTEEEEEEANKMYATRSSPSTSFRYCYTTSAAAAAPDELANCYPLPPTQRLQARGFCDEPTKLSFASKRMKEYFETFKSHSRRNSSSATGSGGQHHRLYQFFKSTRTELIASLLFTVILSHSLIICRTHLSSLEEENDATGSVLGGSKNKLIVHLLAGGLVSSFTVATLTQVFGPISGCHLAPAVSLALYFKGHISRTRLASYLGAQALGSLVGVALLGLLTSSQITTSPQGVNYSQQLALADAHRATLAQQARDNDAMSGDNRLKMTTDGGGGGGGGASTSNLRSPQVSLATTTQSDDLFELKSKAARQRRRRRSLNSSATLEYPHNEVIGNQVANSTYSNNEDENGNGIERSETILVSIEEQKERELEAKVKSARHQSTSKERDISGDKSEGLAAYTAAAAAAAGTSVSHSLQMNSGGAIHDPDGDIARIQLQLAASNVTSNSLGTSNETRNEFQLRPAPPEAAPCNDDDDNATSQVRHAQLPRRLAMVPLGVDLRPTSGGVRNPLIETTTPAALDNNNKVIKLPPASLTTTTTTTTTTASRLPESSTTPTISSSSSRQATKIVKRRRRTHSSRSFPPNAITNAEISSSNNNATGSAESSISNLLAFALPDQIMSSDSIGKCRAEKYLEHLELKRRNFRFDVNSSGEQQQLNQQALRQLELRHCLGLSNGSQMFIFQLMGTLLIVLTYLTNVDPRRTDLGFKSLSIGLGYFLAHLLTLTSGGFYPNPSQLLALFWFQSSGPTAANWQPEWFIYLVTPLIGGLFGALSHEYIDFTSLRNRSKQLHLRRSFYSLDNLANGAPSSSSNHDDANERTDGKQQQQQVINAHNYQPHRHRSQESSQASSLEPASSSFTIQADGANQQATSCNETMTTASNSLGARSSLLALHAIESATTTIGFNEPASNYHSRQSSKHEQRRQQLVGNAHYQQQADSNFLIAAAASTLTSCPQVAGSAPRRHRNSPTSSVTSAAAAAAARRPVYVHERAGIF